jgi:hypothetical protein
MSLIKSYTYFQQCFQTFYENLRSSNWKLFSPTHVRRWTSLSRKSHKRNSSKTSKNGFIKIMEIKTRIILQQYLNRSINCL